MKTITFGDSWAAGAELKENEKPYVHWMAKQLGVEYINYGREGFSLGNVLQTLVANIADIEQSDLVTVIIPPDVRWYDENEQDGFHQIYSQDGEGNLTPEYERFLGNKSMAWFEYHHALFVYAIQKILDDIGCQYCMAHNYGQIDRIYQFGLKVDKTRFLDSKSLTEKLNTFNIPSWETYNKHFWDGPGEDEFQGRYFEGCTYHPNELGHKKIAELFVKYFNL